MIELEKKAAIEETIEEEIKSKPAIQINRKRRRSETPAPSKTIKRLWKKRDKKDRHLSLKQFAREINSAESKEWLSNKHGRITRLEKKKKMETRGATIRATAQASKSSNKK
jgi:hypothetical protein